MMPTVRLVPVCDPEERRRNIRRQAASKAWRKPRRVALPRSIVSLGPLAAFVAFHLGPQLVQRPRTQHGDVLPDHPEWHPHRALAALASDPTITLGLKLGDGAGVGHWDIKAWSDTDRKSTRLNSSHA